MSLLLLFLWHQTLAEPNRARVIEALKALDRVQVDFHQETYSDFLDETAADGVLKIARPGKLHMRYTKGENKEFICDGIVYYEYDRLADSESRVPISDLESEPLVRLLLFGDNLERHFKLEHTRDAKGDIWRLRPIKDSSYYLELSFDDQWLPRNLEVFGKDGEGTRFQFSHWVLKPSFDARTFVVPPAK